MNPPCNQEVECQAPRPCSLGFLCTHGSPTTCYNVTFLTLLCPQCVPTCVDILVVILVAMYKASCVATIVTNSRLIFYRYLAPCSKIDFTVPANLSDEMSWMSRTMLACSWLPRRSRDCCLFLLSAYFICLLYEKSISPSSLW